MYETFSFKSVIVDLNDVKFFISITVDINTYLLIKKT